MSKQRLTIVQVLPELASGGVEVCTLETSAALVAAGHRSIVISSGGPMVAALEAAGSEHIALPVHRKSLRTLRQVTAVRRIVAEVSADVVHARSRVPAWVCQLALKSMPKASRPAFATTVHGLYSTNAYSAVMTYGDAVIAVSNTVRDYIVENYPHCDTRKIRTIPHGIDPTEYSFGYRPAEKWQSDFAKQFPQTNGKQLVTLPGRLTRLKGHFDFLDAIERLPDSVHGLIVGGEDPRRAAYAAELRDAIVDRQLSNRITLTGHRSDLRNVMAISDVVLSLSTKPESFGKTALEAVSLGKPVIGYDHGGVGEILDEFFPDGQVAVGDAGKLVACIQSTLANRPDVRENREWTLSRAMERELDVYQQLAGRQGVESAGGQVNRAA